MALQQSLSILRGAPQRLAALRPDSPRQFGKMTPVAMLGHVRVPIQMALGETPVEDKGNLLTRIVLKPVVLYGPWPKGKIAAPPAFFPEKLEDFETERRALIEVTARLVSAIEQDPARRYASIMFGPMTAAETAHLNARHLAHHLGQFGV